jgi:hypothetical protein
MPGPRVEFDADGFPVFIDTVTADELRKLLPSNPADFETVHNYLRVYGLDDPSDLANFQQQYLSRFNITSDSPQYEAALRQLSEEAQSRRVAVAQSRRAAQTAETIQALGGEMGKVCIYVNDGPDPCDNCLELGGEEKTYREFVQDGELPGDRCLGGDNCLCILIPIN